VDFTLAIIAGGKAQRLGGVTKALIEVDGVTILSRLLRLNEGGPVVIVTDRASEFAGWRCVGDVEPNRGAPGGLVTGLLEASTPWVLVVAGDMPFVAPEHVVQLQERALRGDVEVVIASRGDRLEPLFGLYRSELGPQWRPKLTSNPSVRELIATVRWDRVELEPRALDSLNAPEDLARVSARQPNR
jgi:molybdopterin-guanine dinucleotide biosynthesis protein A